MLRLWNIRTSVSQCGTSVDRTRSDLSGDTTSRTLKVCGTPVPSVVQPVIHVSHL